MAPIASPLMSSSTPKTVTDYVVLSVSLPASPSFSQPAQHYIYVRPHAPRIPDPDAARSLFLANLPIDATEDALRSLFAEQLGGARIGSVKFDGLVHGTLADSKALEKATTTVQQEQKQGKKRKRGTELLDGELGGEEGRLPVVWSRDVLKSGSSAIVVFVDEASRDGAMKEVKRKVKSEKEVIWKTEGVFGEKRYHAHHDLSFPSHSALSASVGAYLSAFSKSEEVRARLLARQRTVPDEDGFITVTRGGRAGPARLEDAEAAAQRLAEREQKKTKENFYRFQLREKRKEKEIELRKAFEEDRRKVEEMKKSRGKVKVSIKNLDPYFRVSLLTTEYSHYDTYERYGYENGS